MSEKLKLIILLKVMRATGIDIVVVVMFGVDVCMWLVNGGGGCCFLINILLGFSLVIFG